MTAPKPIGHEHRLGVGFQHRIITAVWILFCAGLLPETMLGRDIRYYIKRDGFSWKTESATNIIIYFEPGTHAEREIAQLKTQFERSLQSVEELLGTSPYTRRIHVFVLESGERKKALMGDEGWGSAIPKLNAVFGVINRRGDGCSTHEFCHVIAGNLWGKPERWIDEGLATYADERWRSRIHAAAKDLSAQGRLLHLDRMFREFLQYPEAVAHVEAGSFVRFLHEKSGTEKLKKIWQTGHAKISKITGQSMEIIEKEWHNAFESAQSVAATP